MAEIKRGRRPIGDQKKIRMNVAVTPTCRQELERISEKEQKSVSQMIEEYVQAYILKERQEQAEAEKAAKKAERLAKKKAKENEQLEGQMTVEDVLK